jgi:hypothetical protein
VGLKAVPTIPSIQRTTVVVAVFAAAGLLIKASSASAFACILGAALMVVNLTVLSWTVRAMFALARQARGATVLGLIAAPLKMLFLAGIAYLIIGVSGINLPGFIIGTLTQFVAIFIEIGRISIWGRLSAPSIEY